ncbi:MAG TPA: peptide-methionine (R)-S-oxide reductase MsrB [Spirochaetales bacterium]|nr:peptide-methionine (R)-S-oxide reductase MsrB [Spirochaetales bacterium]
MITRIASRGRAASAACAFCAYAVVSCGGVPSTQSGKPATAPIETGKETNAMPVNTPMNAANVCYVEPSEELRARLSPEAYAVLVESATEPPFSNEYWDNHRPGVYVDAIDGAPLFASLAKYDSGSGWPSFWAPIDPGRLVLVEDRSYGMRRIEVRAKASGGHLGHLFDDGPEPTGLRYCINSASLRFVPLEGLEAEGYGELAALFSTP